MSLPSPIEIEARTTKLLYYGCPAYLAKWLAAALTDELQTAVLCGARNWSIKTDILADYIDDDKGGPAHRAENVAETTKRLAEWAKGEAEKAR